MCPTFTKKELAMIAAIVADRSHTVVDSVLQTELRAIVAKIDKKG